jgi:hypothetical protein
MVARENGESSLAEKHDRSPYQSSYETKSVILPVETETGGIGEYQNQNPLDVQILSRLVHSLVFHHFAPKLSRIIAFFLLVAGATL